MYILLSNNGIAAWLTMLTLDEKETKKEAPRKVKEIVNKKPIKKITIDNDEDEEEKDVKEEPIKEETKEETKEEETSLEQESKKKRKKRRKKKKTQVIENE